MFVFALICILLPFVLSSNHSFYNIHIAPTTLTSVPYLNGEITVYEHRANQSRFYLPPLAILQLNDTQVLYNQFTNRWTVRLALVLFTDQLHQAVLEYLQKTLNRCPAGVQCQIKMIPIDRLRIVWKRLQALSSNYELDSSWMSNTILLSTIYFNIDCTTETACRDLQEGIIERPEIIDGLELEYSTPTEQHLRRDLTVTGSHVMNTNMFASLKQMHTTANADTRYLLADDMNVLISEVIANVEMTDVTDVGYVSHDDQTLMRDLLKNRIALNQEILLGHKARQWESVYWNSDNTRPDLTVKLLNEKLSRQDNEITQETQAGLDSDVRTLNESANAARGATYDDASKQFSSTNNTANSVYSDKSHAEASLSDVGSENTQDISSSSADAQSHHSANAGATYSNTRTRNSQSGSSGFLFFGGSRGSSSDVSSIHGNAHANYDGKSAFRSGSNRNMNHQKNRNVDYKSGSQNQVDAESNQKYAQETGSIADIRARNSAAADYKKLADMDSFATSHLDKASRSKYEESRQYLEFNGNRFEAKPVTAYRVNLGQFHETLKLVSKSIVVQRIDSIHAIPIRALGEPLVLSPMLERYKVNMDQKLVELKTALLDSIQQTFLSYKQEARTILDETMSSTVRIINKALVKDGNASEMDTDLRFLIKKALTKTMNLEDVGLFDNGILNYYRHHATPIEQITIASLQPLKIGLHFQNIYIEGMVCDDQFEKNDAIAVCRTYLNTTSIPSNVRFEGSIIHDQKSPVCRFKTTYVNELVPCPFIMNSLDCTQASKTIKECKYQRPISIVSHNSCQSNEHINIVC